MPPARPCQARDPPRPRPLSHTKTAERGPPPLRRRTRILLL
jgi:hypothetical protein